WRASSVPAQAVIPTTSETDSHGVSIDGSPSCATVASTTTACGESRLLGRAEWRPGRPTNYPTSEKVQIVRFGPKNRGGPGDRCNRAPGRGHLYRKARLERLSPDGWRSEDRVLSASVFLGPFPPERKPLQRTPRPALTSAESKVSACRLQ